MILSPQDQRLCNFLRDLPHRFRNRFTPDAHRSLLEFLFFSLSGQRPEHVRLLWPRGPPTQPTEEWDLRKAQGAIEGAEYSAAARGKACGHIFKNGETNYRCKTCTIDDTCVLCSRCFNASDHTGHQIYVSISPGNSGCCDCGDPEAWRLPVNCAIHTILPNEMQDASAYSSQHAGLPQEVTEQIRLTIARAIDYLCDVISCSPEQLRLSKTEASILHDEKMSRLNSKYYDGSNTRQEGTEFALVLWNDEKHTVPDVQEQVARACKKPKKFGLEKAHEVNDIGRSVIEHDTNVPRLLARSRIIEHIKVTVTIRSSRDIFREQMCGAIVEWLLDISGCSVGENHDILKETICEEMLKPWRTGSEALNAEVGKRGIFDHAKEEEQQLRGLSLVDSLTAPFFAETADNPELDEANDDNDNSDEGGDGNDDDDDDDDDEMEIDADIEAEANENGDGDGDGDLNMDPIDDADIDTEVSEATFAGYPPPPPPPAPLPQRRTTQDPIGSDSEIHESQAASSGANKYKSDIPRTPSCRLSRTQHVRAPKYWLEKPSGYDVNEPAPVAEDLRRRVRLDWMILFDLRLWKKARIDLRDLYITTVVSIPKFKRILGLRFAGLYTTLAQLYLIADREPDHSIINLSLQMLTTPSITDEVVEKGNFLTNLIAILYTFLTSRQVGHPQDVQPTATLAFDTGSLTNRRMYHFFRDLRHLFSSKFVQEKLRHEERYMLQFLDLVKIHQGISPNHRAVGDHVEYETDTWISASLITRELNRLCRQFAESFMWRRGEDVSSVSRAIRLAAKVAILSSLGLWRQRFDQAEIKEETKFKRLGDFEFDTDDWGHPKEYAVVKFVVEKQPISFHHALHYTLSWLIDCAKGMSRDQLRRLLLFSGRELRDKPLSRSDSALEYEPEDFLLAMFDFPLRVCAWLAQMKAGMWVRNGLSLRHQMCTYRGVSQRDFAHQRDIFLLQTALVTCNPSRVLASMIDRFGMDRWMKGNYAILSDFDENQAIDVAEDFVHLLIVLLCDRTSLIPSEDEPQAQTLAMRRDIAHVLCFKPLPFSDLTVRLSEKVQDMDELQDILQEMTRYRPPEGLNDTGSFELKDEYLEEIDPYVAHYTKNQREEAEAAYRSRMSKKTRKAAADVVYEPKLRRIQSGVFLDLGAVTRTDIFAQAIYYLLRYPLLAKEWTRNVPATRFETFLQVILHLALIAVIEDGSDEDDMSEESLQSFANLALTKQAAAEPTQRKTIVGVLQSLLAVDEFRACHAKIKLILRRLHQKRPRTFTSALSSLGIPLDRLDTASPAAIGIDDLELKKKQALERQAKVMAQFQQQQQKFLSNHDFDWGEEDFSDLDVEVTGDEEATKCWKYPTGTCILCQEETNDARLYGTFALILDSNILRQTDQDDDDFVAEAASIPSSLDRSADDLRPFGVSGHNKQALRKLTADGGEVIVERQGVGKGFPSFRIRRGPVTTGCGHIMHYACFELYYQATRRRQENQVARSHPEDLDKKEFVCPLCKAIGNAFLPIIWRGKEEAYPGVLQTRDTFNGWLTTHIGPVVSRLEKAVEGNSQEKQAVARHQDMFSSYASKNVIPPVSSTVEAQTRSTLSALSSYAQMSVNQVNQAAELLLSRVSPGHAAPHEAMPTIELANIYRRLRDTVKTNQLYSRYSSSPVPLGISEDLIYTDTLARTLGFSISAVEIAQRGTQSEAGATLLDKIPPQSLTTLRILSETVFSYVAVGSLRGEGSTKTMLEFLDTQNRQLHQLLGGHPQIFDGHTFPEGTKQVEPLFSHDIFVFLAECSVCIVPSLHLDVHHVMRLCYLAEVVKVVLTFSDINFAVRVMQAGSKSHLGEALKQQTATNRPTSDLEAFSGFLDQILGGPQAYPGEFLRAIRVLVENYALTFLRKCVILLHVRYGVDFPNNSFSHMEEPEIDRLTKALRLPSLEEMFQSVSGNDTLVEVVPSIVAGWVRHWMWTRDAMRQHQHSPATLTLALSHPGLLELVGLPKNHDTLLEEAMRRKCPTTGKEQYDPSICLFCGDIFCGQAWCCQKLGPSGKPQGGCNQHMAKCGKNVGLFINIRKCSILYLMHGRRVGEGRGGWVPAPYLDKHGEMDPGLRRGRQLFLNQRRYDALLRNVWLHHGIPSTIARKLEADINNGGWETI
ncbi:MAG: hypothetical protein M1833_003480 [Piccolia ochrophora]|nr:MAG: hypothetical protein M1833_003480 [Piccolia ochrophora]